MPPTKPSRQRLLRRFNNSNPRSPKAANLKTNGQVAQSVEQGTKNPCVGSSILSLATISS